MYIGMSIAWAESYSSLSIIEALIPEKFESNTKDKYEIRSFDEFLRGISWTQI